MKASNDVCLDVQKNSLHLTENDVIYAQNPDALHVHSVIRGRLLQCNSKDE